MTAHELARKLLAIRDQPVKAFDADTRQWEEVTGFTWDGAFPCVMLETDSEDEDTTRALDAAAESGYCSPRETPAQGDVPRG